MHFKLEELLVKTEQLSGLLVMLEGAITGGTVEVNDYKWGVNSIVNLSLDLKEEVEELLQLSLKKDVR